MKNHLLALAASFSLFAPNTASCDLDDSCQDILNKFSQVKDLLDESLPIDTLFIVDSLPINLSQPGKYTVLQDLTYSGSGPAITVSGNNISINFHNHSLTLDNDDAIGIYAANINEFSLDNDLIDGKPALSVHLVNVNKGELNNIYTTNKVTIEQSSDVAIRFSHFATSDGVAIINSSHITIDSCTFHEDGIFIDGPSHEVILKNSTFSNCLNAICAQKVEGLIIENCKASASATSQTVVTLGGTGPNMLANDILIRDSCFTQSETAPNFIGMYIVAGTGCILENVVLDTLAEDAMHVQGTFEDLVAKNSILRGQNSRTVHIEQGNNITLDGCHISGGQVCNVKLLNATSCTVKNCTIFDGYHGIHIDNTSGGGENSVKENFVYNNEAIGISVDDMAKNNVSNNILWSNGTGLQIAFSDYTETFFNTSCNNSGPNCINVYPSQAPGSQTVIPGANLCCD